MSVELRLRLHERFSLRSLRQRTREFTGLNENLAMVVARRGPGRIEVAPDGVLDLVCGPGVEQPDVRIRVTAGEGATDLVWVDVGYEDDPEGGVWRTASVTWRDEVSLLLCAYAAIAAAQLGRSVVVDESSLLGQGRLVDPEAPGSRAPAMVAVTAGQRLPR